jgi:hypothetical protein
MTVFLTWLKIIPTILSTVMSTIAALEQGFQEVAGATGNSAAQTRPRTWVRWARCR